MRNRQKQYDTRREKVIDFLIGFFGWFILNGLMSLVTTFAPVGITELTELFQSPDVNQIFQGIGGIVGILIVCLPLLINVVLLIYFAFTRYWIAIGGASAFASLLILTICAGIVFTAACFILLSNPNTGF